MRTRVKICGITNVEDARAAVDYGADALGFILVPESPRHVGHRTDLSAFVRYVGPFVTTVGVCRCVADIVPHNGVFDAVQVYSVDSELATTYRATRNVILACRVSARDSLASIEESVAESMFAFDHAALNGILLDAYSDSSLGGTGETFNWDLAVEAEERFEMPIILAGGLTPDNVGDAIAKVKPYAVDVSSGVEAEPGRKDHGKLRAFFQAVRAADRLLYS